MPAVSSAIAVSAPVCFAQAIFATRRANNSADTIEKNPVEGIMNGAIAGAQGLKLVTALRYLNPTNDIAKNGAKNMIKETGSVEKAFKGLGKILTPIANNINNVIYLTSIVKVLGSKKDKTDAAIEEGGAIGVMRLCEELYNKEMGMPKVKIKNLKQVVEEERKMNPFIEKHLNTIADTKTVKSILEKLPEGTKGSLKGIGFALASILGYQVGHKLATCIVDIKNGNN